MKAKFIQFAVSAAFLIGSLVVLIAAASSDAIDGPLSVFAAIWATGFVATLIHEIAHAWIALKRGAEINTIAVIPFSYLPLKRKFAFMRYVPSGDIGGYVNYTFPGDFGTRRDEIAIAAAGPAANFLTAALLLLAINVWPADAPAERSSAMSPIVAIEEGQPPMSDRPAQFLPSQEKIDAIVRETKDRACARDRHELFTALINLLIVVSIVSGVLNLLPYKGSDGAIILEHLRWR
ncbi:site-2 protease family protein [uncultured Erythrobacter sp.]|uniref:site-2 protease family protein n=1 Tax=uncultured Erythrobacter sp. TaxID=263913 RepID=UPI00262AA790|nr:site-2 protease family protein [uncultured Erythrobacter sp.]